MALLFRFCKYLNLATDVNWPAGVTDRLLETTR
jgi:hypothetical protein